MQLSDDDKRAISESPMFQGVAFAQIESDLQAAVVRELQPGEILLTPGTRNYSIFVVLSGQVNICLDRVDGPPVAKLAGGECVGDLSIIDDSPVSAFVVSHGTSRVLVIPDTVVWGIMQSALPVALNLLRILSRRIRHDNQVITDSLKMQQQYQYTANIDGLSGLYNRRWLDEMFPRQLERCFKDRQAASLMMLDIDHFKQFNDGYGHVAGDRAIVSVARKLTEQLRPTDLFARYGGEEFAVLLPRTGLGDARHIADRLRKAIAANRITLLDNAEAPPVTISIGLAEYQTGQDLSTLVAAADAALYRAKESGRNCVMG